MSPHAKNRENLNKNVNRRVNEWSADPPKVRMDCYGVDAIAVAKWACALQKVNYSVWRHPNRWIVFRLFVLNFVAVFGFHFSTPLSLFGNWCRQLNCVAPWTTTFLRRRGTIHLCTIDDDRIFLLKNRILMRFQLELRILSVAWHQFLRGSIGR